MTRKIVPKKPKKSHDLSLVLRRQFGKSCFRPMQKEVIEAALNREDVFVQAATAFGKSLCYQLPAVIDYGITIVVSPLLALMNNQVAALEAAGIKVGMLNSQTHSETKQEIVADLHTGHPRIRLLYVTPEYTTMSHFRRVLTTVWIQEELARIAIDEAHCISEWGHDFRPAFQALSWFRSSLPGVPIMCLTATATEEVRGDIISMLNLDRRKLHMFYMSTTRPNLHYEVRFKSDEADHYDDFLKWLKSIHKRRETNSQRFEQLSQINERIDNVCGIIYTLFRQDCEALASRLRQDGIGAKPYHAGLTAETKDDHLDGWVANKKGYDIIVATTAFGMGIDKDNVRFVVHWQIPKSFEGFYQEAGRAGRDGKASACILYYGREDRDRASGMLQREHAKQSNGKFGFQLPEHSIHRAKSLQALVEYCEDTSTCRHQLIARYFAEDGVAPCDYACDWHKDAKALAKAKEAGLASEEWVCTQRDAGAYSVSEDE